MLKPNYSNMNSSFKRHILINGTLALTMIGLLIGITPLLASPQQILKPVDLELVCMINNQVFPNKQIPVKVNDKIYYGCCEMCKKRLSEDPHVRIAIDPISGKPVDKALAIVGAYIDNTVYYFQNKENMNKFTINDIKRK